MPSRVKGFISGGDLFIYLFFFVSCILFAAIDWLLSVSLRYAPKSFVVYAVLARCLHFFFQLLYRLAFVGHLVVAFIVAKYVSINRSIKGMLLAAMWCAAVRCGAVLDGILAKFRVTQHVTHNNNNWQQNAASVMKKLYIFCVLFIAKH